MLKKLNNIQALRAFAVLLVVGLHLLAVEVKYSQFDVLLPTFLRIGISGVDLFFVISGFIMVTVTADLHGAQLDASAPLSRRVGAWRFLYMRLSRIYPLYWLVSAVVLVIFLSHPTFLNAPHFSVSFVIHSFLLLPQQGLPLLMVGWSLVHEMYFYLVFAIFLLLPRKYLPYLLFAWLCVVIEGFRHVEPFNPEQNPYTRFAFSPITTEFIAGCFLALFFENRTRKAGEKFVYPLALPSLLLGFVSLLLLWHYFSFNTETIDVIGWTRVYLFTLPYVLMIYGAVALEHNGREHNGQWTAPAFAVRIGDHSYSIYLTHILVLSLCGRAWKTFAWAGYIDNIIILSATMVGVLLCGRWCYNNVEKPLLDLSRRLATHG